ncbi:tyrosine-type recombinase/integrase [Mesorhizobium sp. A556]
MSDDQQAGLRVRVSTSGVLTWNVAYRIKGEGKAGSVSLGLCDPAGKNGLGLSEARERAADILKAARQGRDLLSEENHARQAEKELLTVAHLIDRYGKNIKSPNRKGGALRTADDIERRLKRAMKPQMQTAAENIKRSQISNLLDPVASNRPREAEKRRQAIGAMFRWGLAKGYVTIDPTAGTETYGRGDPRDRVLTPDEIKSFWAWLDVGAGKMPPDCISVLRLQICLGARVGELAGMDASEVHEEDNRLIWTLPASRSKNKSERITPLVGYASEIITDALQARKRGPLFRAATIDRALQATDLGHALKNRKLPCAHFTTHDLRRTVVSIMDEMGIALDTIATVVGHQRGSKDTRVLIRHYSRPRLDERIEAALSAWDSRLRSIVSDNAGQPNDNIVRLHG